MITYNFSWERSGTFTIGEGSKGKRLDFEYQCIICHRYIPRESTALIIQSKDANVFTHHICTDCVMAIAVEVNTTRKDV